MEVGARAVVMEVAAMAAVAMVVAERAVVARVAAARESSMGLHRPREIVCPHLLRWSRNRKGGAPVELYGGCGGMMLLGWPAPVAAQVKSAASRARGWLRELM